MLAVISKLTIFGSSSPSTLWKAMEERCERVFSGPGTRKTSRKKTQKQPSALATIWLDKHEL